MENENKVYQIKDEINTTIYSIHILNGLEEYIKLDIPYFVINSFNIEKNRLVFYKDGSVCATFVKQ